MLILKWIISSGLLLLPVYAASKEVQYECGAHGRFEYCVDGIPGCVIGCHCHPGFYFDTESKICEPNTQLTQQYRRNNLLEPTRVQIRQSTLGSTTNNPIDEKVEEIAKDADDLGDWLYNQFFKTIENQVINNTDKGDIITRRSGKNPLNPKSKRKTRKFWKKSSKKKKNKKSKKGLRSKLLRITEDDSLFESSSSNSDGDSSSSSGSGSSESSASLERDTSKSHEHKKFLFFNKKPKPPLPSFIFLPNMVSPFYPPIGLPPPPVPMYPMVPVPPMGPFYPVTASTGTPATVVDCTKPTVSTTILDNDNENTPAPTSRKRGRYLHGHNKPWEHGMVKANNNMNDENNEARKIFLQKLQEKTKNRNKNQRVNDLMEQIQEADSPFLDYSVPGELSFLNQLKSKILTDETPGANQNIEDVGFKYLSELIHRNNLNNTNMKPLESQVNMSERQIVPPEPQRRQNYNVLPPPYQTPGIDGRRHLTKPAGPEDLYYTSLGRQIASLIRNIDSKGDRQVNIEIEQPKKTPVQPMFHENIYAPRSYWERSVRSPMKYHQSHKYQFLEKSNENLFNLESKVEIFATTKPSLTLNELESIISAIDKSKYQMDSQIYDNMSENSSNISLNINLLPKIDKANIDNRRFTQDKYMTEELNNNMRVNSTSTEYLKFNEIDPKLQGIIRSHIQKQNSQVNISNDNTNRDFKVINPIAKPIRRVIDVFKTYQITRRPMDRNIYKWYILPTTKKPSINHSYHFERQYNQQKINYFSNNNPFIYDHNLYPVQKKINKYIEPYIKPSYFHHEMHHLDFFD